jgi:hypothetical protein
MLEFLWVHDEREAKSEPTARTHLLDRWKRRDDGGSPFGICFRPATNDAEAPPFDTWEYRPAYLPDEVTIQIATNAAVLEEPFLFYLPWGRAPESPPAHRAGIRELTAVTVRIPPTTDRSPALDAIDSTVRFESAETWQLRLEFDGAKQGRTIDVRPAAPLTIRC